MKITDHLHMLTIPFTVPTPNGPIPRTANVFLVCCDTVTLVDTAVAGSEDAIFDYLTSIGRGRGEISRLILTHSHPDHVGSAAAIRRETGCRVLAGAGERGWIEDVELQQRERPVPGFAVLVGGSVQVDQVLAHGEMIAAGEGVTMEILETPGHSAGSLSLFLRPSGVLITGDAIPLPGDMPIYDDYRQSVASLQHLASVTGVNLLLESWREEPTHDPARRIQEGLQWLERVDAAVLRQWEEGCDRLGLCRRVVADLGLPPFAVNPLVARSLWSHGAVGVSSLLRQ